MSFYSRRIFPGLVDWALRNEDATACRERIVPLARGRVMEIGIGSGLNLPFYGSEVDAVVGLDPSAELLAMAKERSDGPGLSVFLIRAAAEAVPLADRSVDTVVMTWTLCSVSDAPKALGEARRVLRPDGRLLFVEHGLAPEAGIVRWQRRLDPLWTKISCHLDRPVPSAGRGGFRDRRDGHWLYREGAAVRHVPVSGLGEATIGLVPKA